MNLMLFASLKLYINCLEDSRCSLLQQDLGLLSVQRREGKKEREAKGSSHQAADRRLPAKTRDGKIGVQPGHAPCMFGTLAASCGCNTARDFSTELSSASKEEGGGEILGSPAFT